MHAATCPARDAWHRAHTMSDPVVNRPVSDSATRSRRGQSMVEFALVLPMLIVLLLGIADLGRVFAAGITVEAAARDAAEIVAQEYLRSPPGGEPMSDPAPPGSDAYYQPLHALAARTACRESRVLLGTSYTPDDAATPSVDEESCGTMPIRTCIHDEEDTRCGEIAYGATVPVGECAELSAPMTSAMEGGTEESRYVEVRICYRFTTLVNMTDVQLPFGWGISVGDIWLQKDRVFNIGYYPPPPTPTPPPPPSPPPPTTAPTETPSPSPNDLDCDDFPLTEEVNGSPAGTTAQEVLDADPTDPFGLDADGDGIACEIDESTEPTPTPSPIPEPTP